jgi:hypothetical protein
MYHVPIHEALQFALTIATFVRLRINDNKQSISATGCLMYCVVLYTGILRCKCTSGGQGMPLHNFRISINGRITVISAGMKGMSQAHSTMRVLCISIKIRSVSAVELISMRC